MTTFYPRLSAQLGDVERLRREVVVEIKRLVTAVDSYTAAELATALDAAVATLEAADAALQAAIDAVEADLAAHASTHLPGGSDALTYATAVELTDATNAEGGDATVARGDHEHAHGNRGGGSLHADVVAGGADGFMTGADKAKLDGLASAPTAGQTLVMPPGFGNTGLSSTKTITSGRTFAVYMGRLPRAVTTVDVVHRVTTAFVGATSPWAEVAVATGLPVTSGNPTLTVVGVTDVSAIYNALGVFRTSITATIAAGEHWWLMCGNSTSGTAVILRGASSPDDILAGHQALVVNRPTSILNTPTAFTQEGSTTVPAWTAGWA